MTLKAFLIIQLLLAVVCLAIVIFWKKKASEFRLGILIIISLVLFFAIAINVFLILDDDLDWASRSLRLTQILSVLTILLIATRKEI